MHIQPLATAPINERGGQTSHLLLGRDRFGSRSLAVTWVDCPPRSLQALHTHADSEQVYVIVRGRGVMQVGDETQDVGEGSLVFIPPRAEHAIRNDGDEPLTFVSAMSPPFDPAERSDYFAYRGRGTS
jgi:mannose-6-phosphate isomerase-like protein (cupin superfamily)